MTNSELLKKTIDESGLKLSFIAEKMGISRDSLYRKINNKTAFNQYEINDLCDVLKIDSLEQKDAIFLLLCRQKSQQRNQDKQQQHILNQ